MPDTKPKGRPPLPPEQKVTAQLKTQVTEAEADAITRYANAKGRSVSQILRAYCRRLLRDERG